MVDLWMSGPDALDLFEDHAVNGFSGFECGRAKQFVLATPEGYFIGDGILFHLGETLALVGPPANVDPCDRRSGPLHRPLAFTGNWRHRYRSAGLDASDQDTGSGGEASRPIRSGYGTSRPCR